MSLGADDPGPGRVQEFVKLEGMEWPAFPINEASHAILFGFRLVVGKAIQLLEPERMLLGLFVIEALRIENAIERRGAHHRFDDIRLRVEGADDFSGRVGLRHACRVDLVEDNDIGKFNLFDQQIDERPLIFRPERLAAIGQEIARRIVAKEIDGVDDRHHRVKPRHISKRGPVFLAEMESCGDRERL